MSVHCGAHCSVHCACAGRALRKTRSLCNSASGGVEAHATLVHRAVHFLPTCGANPAMSLLCLWLAAWKMRVRLDWGFGTCKREFVQACVCTSINRKIFLLLLCLRLAAWKVKVFGLRLQESGEDFLVYGCANTSLDKFPFARAKTLIQTHFHLPSC